MRYWDSSALVVLHVEQASTKAVRSLYAADSQILTWVLSDVEVRSALVRLARDGALDRQAFSEAVRRAERFWEVVHFVSLVDAAKVRAKRLLGVHALRTADSMQLGAALAAAGDDPSGWEFACLDARLGDAALHEGFSVVP